jgi:hypothetical protein
MKAAHEQEQWPSRHLTATVAGERYIATLSQGAQNWSLHVPRLPGLVVTGEYKNGVLDIESARRKLAEGIEFHLEGLAIERANRDKAHAAG